jgi:ribosomal protein S18 acetylase RimI-like enzyme
MFVYSAKEGFFPSIGKRYDVLEPLIIRGRYNACSSPHYYIVQLGTHPEFQGQGAGSALMKAVISLGDRNQLPCYLECTGMKNRVYYQKFGFELVESHENLAVPGRQDLGVFDPEGGLSIMRRNPKLT